MKRFTSNLIYLLSLYLLFIAASTPLAAQTDVYIHFAGQGKYVLNVDGTGALSTIQQTDENAAPADGMSWTITGNDTNGYKVNSGSRYLKYDGSNFVTTDSNANATVFDKRDNDYYPETRTSLVLRGHTLDDGSAAALGMENGKLVLAKVNSRYDCLRLANKVFGPDFPKYRQEDGNIWYNIQFSRGASYINVPINESNLKCEENNEANKNQPGYAWQFVKADEEGNVYIENYRGGYIKAGNGISDSYSIVETRERATKFKLTVFNDNNYKGSFSLYELNSGKDDKCYINRYNSGPKVASWTMDEGGRLNINVADVQIEDDLEILNQPHYLHFAGQGKNALFVEDNGTVIGKKQTDATAAPAGGFAWTITKSENGYIVQNALGKYLEFADNANEEDCSFTTVDAAIDATLFDIKKNVFHRTGEERYSLILKGKVLSDGSLGALGMKHGKITVVPFNSRYDCLRLKDNVVGPDFPKTMQEGGGYYNISFPYTDDNRHIRVRNVGGTIYTTTNPNQATINTNEYLWQFEETGDNSGEVYIKHYWGGYMNSTGNDYILTAQKSDATRFKLLVFNDNNEYNTTFAIYEIGNRAYDRSFMNARGGSDLVTFWQYNSVGSKVAITENSEAKAMTHKYIQFSGSGNMVLFDNGEGKLEIHRIIAANVNQKGYFWTPETVKWKNDKQLFRLHSEEGNYVIYDDASGTFKTTPDKEIATTFDCPLNTYMLNGEFRYNINLSERTDTRRAMGLKQGDDGELHLTLTETDSRMACIRITDNIPAREFPKLSTGTVFAEDENSTWYSIRFRGSNNYIFKTDQNIYCQQNPTDITGPLFKWRFIRAYDADGIYRGDVYIQNQSGYFIKWDGSKYYVLTDQTDEDAKAAGMTPDANGNYIPADATTLRITCYNDDSNETTNSGWHIRPNSGSGNVYMYNNNGQPGRTDGPKAETSIDITNINSEYFRYVVFPAAGSRTLCDGLNREDTPDSHPHAHRMETGEVNQDHLRWHLKMVNSKGQVILKNRFGKYLTWNKTDGFGTSDNEADAYRFGRQRNNYEDNKRLRYELLKNDDPTQALSIINLETSNLGWGKTGTRFSVLYTFETVAGPALPQISVSGSDFHLYRIRMQEGNHYCISDPNTQTTGESVELQPQDEGINQLWSFVPHYPVKNDPTSFIGDYYLRNVHGKYLALNSDHSQIITQTDSTGAAVIRLIETNSHYYSWQLQVLGLSGKNIISAENTSFTLREANNDNNFFRLLPENIFPEFYGLNGGSWNFIRFKEVDGMPFMVANESGEVEGSATITENNEEHAQWKNVGTENDFILRNGNGQFIKENENGQIVLTDNIDEAKHFYLWINHIKDNTTLWTVCELPDDGIVPDIPERIMQLGTDNKVYMVDCTTDILSNPSVSQEWTKNATPTFSDDECATYYFINMGDNMYMNDGPDGVHDAKANEKERLNGFIWKLYGQKNELRLISRNGEYLVWNPIGDNTFGVSTNPDSAAIFKFHTTALVGNPHTDETDCYFELTGGIGTEGFIGRFITRNGDNVVLTENATDAYVRLEQLLYFDAGDYKNFRIIPKRSWFLYQAMNSPYEPITGFLPKHDPNYGWTKNEYTGKMMQATNTFRITHYMKQGTARNLELPTHQEGGATTRVRSYQRWYDYKTDSLIPDDRVRFIDVTDNKIINSRRDYSNGTIMGVSLPLNYLYGDFVGRNVRFEMPEITTKDYNYLVGLDCSFYTDFVDYFGDNGPIYSGAINNQIVLPDHQNFIEPTLNQRCIYEIRDARQMADSLTACTEGSNKWVEQHTITFPKKKMGFSHPTIPLNLQLQDYWFYKSYKAGEEPTAKQLQNIVNYDYIYFVATSYKGGTKMTTGKISGFDIKEWPVEGANASNSDLSKKRFVRFIYPKSDGTGVSNPGDMGYFTGDSCIIQVYARDGGSAGIVGAEKHYQLARIKLLFEDNIEPRVYTEIMGLDAEGNYKTHRAPDFMRTRYGGVKASIDFDDPDFMAYQAPPIGKNMAEQGEGGSNGNAGFTENNTYGYPLRFEDSGYNYQPAPQENVYKVTWGGYSIIKKFTSPIPARPVMAVYKEMYAGEEGIDQIDDSYAAFLYVDASEMPGEICSLEYTGNLCTGTRLFFSAWVSSVNRSNDNSVGATPANIIFTVYGITDNDEKVALYTYCPGPIIQTIHDKDGNTKEPAQFGGYVPWQQIYFSFINNSTKRFKKYVLNINNACTNSSGGDIMIDDVNIYSQAPVFNIERTIPVCGQEITLAKMSSPFDALTTSLGLMEKTGEDVLPNSEMPRLWYTIIDKEKYEEKLTEQLAGSKDTTTTHLRNAFNAAIVGKTNSTNRVERAFRYAVLNTNYSKIPDFRFEESIKDIIDDKDPNATGYIRKEIKELERNIVISDQLSAENLLPDHDYYITFVPMDARLQITQSSAFDDYQWGTSCSIRSEFKSENAIRFMSNGVSGDDDRTINACAGQTIGITPQMKGVILTYNEEGAKNKSGKLSLPCATNIIQSDSLRTLNSMQPLPATNDYAQSATSNKDDDIIYKIEHYDWWMDFMGVPLAQAFIDKNGNFVKHENMVGAADEVSVIEALSSFRHFFPKANSPKDADVEPRAEIGYILTDVMIKGLANLEYMGASISVTGDISGTNKFRPLIFNNSTLNLTLPEDMNEDDCVAVTTYPILVTSDDIIFCSDPQTVDVKISGKAPSMADGFYLKDSAEVKYPADKVNVPIRTSVTFLKNVTATTDESTEYTGESMRIPLRDIKTVNSNAIGIQPIVREGDAYAYVFLSGTNDPDMNVYEGENELEYRRIGVIKNMNATVDVTSKSFADIYFLKGFNPREGYTYTLRMEYNEQFAPGESASHLTCDGSMAIDLFIVPKYVVWTGNADNTDWNNDANWKRADLADLNWTAQEATDEGYMSNEANGTVHAFAPLDHTSVIIPNGTVQPELYDNGVNILPLITGETIEQPKLNETATPNIQWDLATHEKSGSFECAAFYNHDIKDMVLKSGAELLRSDYLTKYDSVWVEYSLNPDRWYTLGSPIKDVYAGDWYTDTENKSDEALNGHDLSPYFKPQTFTLARHNRFAPAIYQKSWDKGVATLYYLSDGNSGNELSTNVFTAANWSQVYNDVDVRYGYTYKDKDVDTEYPGIGGFSVKAVSEGIKANHSAVSYKDFLIRIPKEDEKFAIYQIDGIPGAMDKSVSRKYAHRLYSDDLAQKESIRYKATNVTHNNKYFLVGNPFTCGLDMNEFMEKNKDKIETKYWMLTANGQTASIKDETSPSSQWITINGDTPAKNGVLASGQGFFVKTKDGYNSQDVELTFTASMMTSAHATQSQLRTLSHNPNVSQRRTLRIRATRGNHVSEALIKKDTAAANAFAAHEDMEAIYHNTLADAPMVYTIAGKQAAMVNRRKSMYRIPVGVQSNSDAPTLLTFSGMNEFNETLSLLDDLTGEVIPLTLADKDSVTVEVEGNTAGRYFILTSEKPTPEDELTDIKPIVEVVGNKVCISANASHLLTYVHIVDAAGRTVYTMNPYLPALSLKLPTGIYVVEVRTESQSTTAKVTVN